MLRVWMMWFAVAWCGLAHAQATGGASGGAVRVTPMQGRAALDERTARGREALPQVVGFSLNLWHFADRSAVPRAVDRVAELGCNAVQIVTPMFASHGGSPGVQLQTGPGRGPAADDLVAVMRYARGKGLKVVLMPRLELTQPRGSEWRGTIQPADWTKWWESYEQVMDRFTQIAVDGDADVFVVGCELLTTLPEGHVARWVALIDKVRARFKGQVTFSTSWDTYEQVRFWDKLDCIGVGGHWDVTGRARLRDDPTGKEIAQHWADVRDNVLAFGKQVGRPVLLTQVGYPSVPWGLREPWNHVVPEGTSADTRAQSEGYRAFLSAWQGPGVLERPAGSGDAARVAGVLFYEWDIGTTGGPFDTGYGVQGKPAEAVLRRWLAGE